MLKLWQHGKFIPSLPECAALRLPTLVTLGNIRYCCLNCAVVWAFCCCLVQVFKHLSFWGDTSMEIMFSEENHNISVNYYVVRNHKTFPLFPKKPPRPQVGE